MKNPFETMDAFPSSATQPQFKELGNIFLFGLLSFLTALVCPVATVTQVILRKDLGQRYFTAWNYVGGVFVLILATISSFMLNSNWRTSNAWIITQIAFGVVWIFGFSACSVLHFLEVRKRYKTGNVWHSKSTGVSRLPVQFPISYDLAECLCLFVVGIVLSLVGFLAYGVLLVMSGLICWMIYEIAKAEFLRQVLDTIDTQIESENLAKAVVELRSPDQTSGFQVPVPAYIPRNYRERYVQARVGASAEGDADKNQAEAGEI